MEWEQLRAVSSTRLRATIVPTQMAKMPFAEHENMGKTSPPHRTDRTFNFQNIPQHLAPPGDETYHGFRSVSDVASQWRAISMRRATNTSSPHSSRAVRISKTAAE